MNLSDNERLQELAMLAGDKVSMVNRRFWHALIIAVAAIIPTYFIFQFGFSWLFTNNYKPPEIIYISAKKDPLEVLEKKILPMGNNAYSAYVRVRNINNDWGVPRQKYTAEFKTYGGTLIRKVEGMAFILPSTEKLIVFSKITAEQKPDEISFVLDESHFVQKSGINFSYNLERVTTSNNPNGLVVSAGIKNTTAYTINRIHLPVLVYNSQNEVVAVNFHFVNEVKSNETRTFQYPWPSGVPGAIRAEIFPEINIFDSEVLQLPEGVTPTNGR